MLDFSELINEYSTTFTVIEETPGYYNQNNGGIWVSGEPQETQVTGVVMPLSNKELRFDENGTYTASDRKIYTCAKLKIGQKVKYKGVEYTIHADKDYFDQAGLYIYFAKRVGEVDA